jgi:hypothetical protein
MTRLLRSAILMALVAPGAALAQVVEVEAPPLQTDDPAEIARRDQVPTTYRVTLEPAVDPVPALRRQLLPGYWELRPGNAAPFYYRAILMQEQLPAEVGKELVENEERWLKHLDDPAVRKEVQAWLDRHGAILSQLQTATYREEIEFDFRLRELGGIETLEFVLPEIQAMRSLSHLLQIKGRLAIADGRLDETLESMRMGYRLAQAASQPPFLVAGLVGIGIESVMNDVLLHFLAAPGAPNLYWALTDLPQPLVDLRPAMQQEMGLPGQLFPFLENAETAQRSEEEWRRLLADSVRSLMELGGSDSSLSQFQSELAGAGVALKMYPQAKRELIDAGFDRERIEAMPVGQVIAWQTARLTDYASQEVYKWWGLPYWQAVEPMRATEKRLIGENILGAGRSLNRGGLPVASLLLPAVFNVRRAEGRLERNLAALSALEAIRLHAGRTGSLPDTLEELSPPAPINPATGAAFSYARSGDGAVLEAPALAGETPRHSALRYELALRKGE